ncbi:hypothetical protein CEP53_012693 [Fusarium sp. AF-6]|nr:hypothetical protein CEP53_012693 [Fusarium sp. AF-6]
MDEFFQQAASLLWRCRERMSSHASRVPKEVIDLGEPKSGRRYENMGEKVRWGKASITTLKLAVEGVYKSG